MKASAVAVGGLVAVAIAAAVVFNMYKAPKASDETVHPSDKTISWVCVAQDETHDFTMTVGELAKAKEIVCPECGSHEVFRALPCPKCGRHYPIGQYNASPTHCMYCNEPLPGAGINVFHGQEGH